MKKFIIRERRREREGGEKQTKYALYNPRDSVHRINHKEEDTNAPEQFSNADKKVHS